MGLLINQGMLGEVGGFRPRTFFPIDPHRVTPPMPSPRFFETLPTIWAAAYRFRQAVEQGDETARQEWLTLFALHAMGVAYLTEPLTLATLAREYPLALQPALETTHPQPGQFREAQFLSVGATTLGGVYSDVIFFPARARGRWQADHYLRPYLNGEQLSWERAQTVLLTDSLERDRCHRHLRCVARDALPLSFGKILDALCDAAFGPPPYGLEQAPRLSPSPTGWTLVRPQAQPAELLESYPLQKPNAGGGRTYFLVDRFPTPASWMTAALGPGRPSPMSYRSLGPNAIGVETRGRLETLPLGPQDEVVDLASLFLSDFAGRVDYPRDDQRLALIHPAHRLHGLTDASKVSVCLAPITSRLLSYFPELLAEDGAGLRAKPAFDGQSVEWDIRLCGREVPWTARYFEARDLAVASLSLWPPKVDPQWHFYAAHGLGARERAGRWRLVDEAGRLGDICELGAAQDEYVTLLTPPETADAGSRPGNRPRALSWWWPAQGRDVERGIVLLAKLPDAGARPPAEAHLAVDFGTSNTSVAFAASGVTDTLRFSLAPLRLWNGDGANRLGFAPFNWGGSKGYFSTTLLTRRASSLQSVTPETLATEHFFAAAIPNLHADGLNRMLAATGGTNAWDLHDSLKWDQPQTSAYRALFLRLLLLYAHAELFFNRRARVTDYTFTFPLAMSKADRDVFHAQNQRSIGVIQQLCHGERRFEVAARYRANVDESAAAAAGANLPPSADRLDLFIDVGGGTADIAVRRGTDILVLDSLRLAGRQFFRAAEQNLSPRVKLRRASVFRRHLGRLLAPDDAAPAETDVGDMPGIREHGLSLPTFYLLRVNELKAEAFGQRERDILKRQRDHSLPEGQSYRDAYQRFFAQMFFRHLLAYGIVQAAAAAIERNLTPAELPYGIQLVLGGNAWGLLLFADFERSGTALHAEAEALLTRIKQRGAAGLSPEAKSCLDGLHIHDVALLNEGDISRAKTNVPIGALAVSAAQTVSRRVAPFAGVSLPEVVVSDGAAESPARPVRWFNRWSEPDLKRLFAMEPDTDIRQVTIRPPGTVQPLDDLLTLFTSRGSTDLMPQKKWATVNGYLSGSRHYPALTPLALFLTGVLYADPDLKLVTSLPDQPYPIIEAMARKAGFYDDQPPLADEPEPRRQQAMTYE